VEASQPSVNKEGASDTPIGAAEGGNKTASPSAAAAAPDAPQAPEAKDKSESAETETRYCESDREDEEMQRSYDGFWPRFQVFKDMLFMEPSDREAALKRIIKTTSKVYGSSGVYAVPIKIHIDLQVGPVHVHSLCNNFFNPYPPWVCVLMYVCIHFIAYPL
jgi:hypothetical protein